MPRAVYPSGYKSRDIEEQRVISSFTWKRLRQEPKFHDVLRDKFERVLLQAVTLWGADYVIARVQHAIADAEAHR